MHKRVQKYNERDGFVYGCHALTEKSVDQQIPDDRCVRFRRAKIASLEAFPSSEGSVRAALRRSRAARWCRRGMGFALAVGAFLLILAFAVQIVGSGTFGRDRLRAEAQRAVTALAGFDVTTKTGGLRLVLGGGSPVGLEVRDLNLIRSETGDTLLDAGKVRLGFKLLPLLRGRLELGSAKISGVRLLSSNFSSGGTGGALAAIWSASLEPWELRRHVFDAVRQVYSLTDRMGTRQFVVQDVEIASGDGTSKLIIADFAASRSSAGQLDFDGLFNVAGRDVALDGQALRNGANVSFDARISEPTGGLFQSLAKGEHQIAKDTGPLGLFALSLTGEEGEADSGYLDLDLSFDAAPINMGDEGISTASGRIEAEVTSEDNAIAVRRAQFSVGRSMFDFAGSLMPAEQSQREAGTTYEFRLASRRSSVAPTDSPEPAVAFAAQIAGRIESKGRRVVADTIRILTDGGAISASAAIMLESGKTPGISLAIDSSGLPTQYAKQFWPWFAASGARKWVLENLFGGRVVKSNLWLHVPPGRLGNGQPLNADEVSGAFAVQDARFDVAGHIPPVRDGIGRVDFKGADTDIGIDSGTVFMPSGRQVAVSNGLLTVRDAHILPRIGKLEIDIAGEAPAVVELASYEPIDASRVIDLAPQDVTGSVNGHVQADIPLSKDIPREALGWHVKLDYEGLSIAKPFDGQSVTEAKGVLTVVPDQAEITASALLNGIPAELKLIEPIGQSEKTRSRDVTLKLDNKTRDKILPGLTTILSGPTDVAYEELEDGRKVISFDLDAATLKLPWLNWRKGAGIPATASFVLDEGEEVASLTDFNLSGETFSAHGELKISKGEGLISAEFDKIRLNRGDDFAATIQRSGNDYAVSVSGGAFDARATIKYYLGADASSSGSAGETAASGIALTAELASVSGFNGETLRDTVLSYKADGGSTGRLQATGTTSSGGKVTLTRNSNGVDAQFADAGAVMRFLDFYPYMDGGRMQVALRNAGNGVLAGQVTTLDFDVVDEPRLRSLVAAAESDTGGTEVDASRVRFDQGSVTVRKGKGSLVLADGVLRGPLIGTTFQGTLFDAQDNISITGTFMPIYGLNRIFGEIPLFGQILGNGRDRGLIGITYRLFGKFEAPKLQINPISAIAPGIFRQIFEFR